jgi:hypothetical protein
MKKHIYLTTILSILLLSGALSIAYSFKTNLNKVRKLISEKQIELEMVKKGEKGINGYALYGFNVPKELLTGDPVVDQIFDSNSRITVLQEQLKVLRILEKAIETEEANLGQGSYGNIKKRLTLVPCAQARHRCYSGGGNLTFSWGCLEIDPFGQVRVILRGIKGRTATETHPPYRLQVFYLGVKPSVVIGDPFYTDNEGNFDGIVGRISASGKGPFVINSSGTDGNCKTFNTGARQQFITEPYEFNAAKQRWKQKSFTFNHPTIKGYRLDWCRLWATDCGKGAADAFCRLRGYARAESWEMDPDIGLRSPTYVIDSGQICNQWFCDGFKYITCTSSSAQREEISTMGPMEWDTDRMGQDYSNFDLPKANPALCRDACARDPKCKAWTYVKPNTIQGAKPRCWLKYAVPRPRHSTCCVSGVKH